MCDGSRVSSMKRSRQVDDYYVGLPACSVVERSRNLGGMSSSQTLTGLGVYRVQFVWVIVLSSMPPFKMISGGAISAHNDWSQEKWVVSLHPFVNLKTGCVFVGIPIERKWNEWVIDCSCWAHFCLEVLMGFSLPIEFVRGSLIRKLLSICLGLFEEVIS